MPAIFHVPIVSLKTGAGCLQEIEFDSPTLDEPSPFHTNGVLSLFGRLLEAKRSTQTIADDPSWVHTEGKLGIWRSGSPGFQEPPRPPSHCFVLRDEQTSEPIGKVQFDDLSDTPEVFTCLLVEDEKLTGQEDFDVGSVRSLVCCVGEMVTRRCIRKYWILALKPCGQLPRTYRRVGVAVAAHRKIDGTKCIGLPMHKLGRQTRIRLI
ncbi:uncharacterized protein PV06_06863 [Exophiala oligosperma]|uniref:Uncharacterized protein n=1 Tax=Exophiala oligosperma TaxID=215243 RepID=A0A0D2AMU7_9EURO|nr:uncharacterized protein PV06_06863 [Exophiala oligosperma]KIW41291.1 hypothetical protein PV06_06863 [Exophiala oligosperma]